TRMDNAYRQKASKTVKAKFYLTEIPEFLTKFVSTANKIALIAWTTTPWTLPANLALAIGAKIEYALVKKDDEILILAKNLIEKFAKDFGEHQLVGSVMGSELVGLSYQPVFPYFQFLKDGYSEKNISANPNIFTILAGDFVSTEDGTGIVHIASGFGEDDQIIAKANHIPTICPVDEAGKFNNLIINKTLFEIFTKDYSTANLPILQGRQVFETNDDIIKFLKDSKLIFGNPEQILHNYPHCWRTDTPLIYKAVSSWYVKVTAFKDEMVALNQQINWIPENVKDGQFGKWLEGARDWSITRNRFWGCPVPVWKSKSGKIKVFGSIAEIEKIAGKKVDNLHRPFIDEITFEENGEIYERVSDVLDCWFESGSMPFAQVHYPFENKQWFENNFPADFITEYQAQTRGWFYTMMVLSTALFNRIPFKNVICHGTILDENSQKLSKRLRNYADPLEIFSSLGSDAMRFFMISQPVMRGQELRIDKDGKAIRDTLRLSIKPLINAYNFFCLYANADGIKAQRINYHQEFPNILDNYILSKLKNCVNNIEKAMDKFDTVVACDEFNKFFEALNNWYIRRNRQRFW
ncbi:MAG: class I tRNA ligase family protein, partial [Alphaproteobacteria bacterium]